jgi:hypothetical protein
MKKDEETHLQQLRALLRQEERGGNDGETATAQFCYRFTVETLCVLGTYLSPCAACCGGGGP